MLSSGEKYHVKTRSHKFGSSQNNDKIEQLMVMVSILKVSETVLDSTLQRSSLDAFVASITSSSGTSLDVVATNNLQHIVLASIKYIQC